MKKTVCLILALVLAAAALTACGNSGSSDKKTETTAAETTAAQAETTAAEAQAAPAGKFSVSYKGAVINMKDDAAPILAALGEPKSYTEEKSCAFDGLDKNYVYNSIILTTYPDGDKDRINSAVLMDDTVSTTDGICIGDSKEKVEEKYGADSYDGINAYIMTDGTATLTIIMENDKVASIQYTQVTE
ncbi:MAG: hypothetical protein HUJ76_06855 [Parasporobacterium sp.]|nr:hypothetical protein [Parasporobacterium sp.]